MCGMEMSIISKNFEVETFALDLGTQWPVARQLSGPLFWYGGSLLLCIWVVKAINLSVTTGDKTGLTAA